MSVSYSLETSISWSVTRFNQCNSFDLNSHYIKAGKIVILRLKMNILWMQGSSWDLQGSVNARLELRLEKLKLNWNWIVTIHVFTHLLIQCRAGIACIVPPKGWAPPFALDKGTNGQSAESFRFSIRKQPTWQLCMRSPNPKASGPAKASAHGRYFCPSFKFVAFSCHRPMCLLTPGKTKVQALGWMRNTEGSLKSSVEKLDYQKLRSVCGSCSKHFRAWNAWDCSSVSQPGFWWLTHYKN